MKPKLCEIDISKIKILYKDETNSKGLKMWTICVIIEEGNYLSSFPYDIIDNLGGKYHLERVMIARSLAEYEREHG